MTFPAELEIPEDVLEIARTLEEAGHEAWCVGGAIRDTLLHEPNTDYDVATSATPDQVRRLFKHTVAVGERFGTIAVRTRRRHHEVTTFRRDVQTDGRHAVVEYGASLEEDLARRDFTINAIAYHPLRRTWADPFHGADDLEARIIRAVGDPAARFREDYLRILRALRFAARFDFEIEAATWAATQGTRDGVARLSAERVLQEWYKGLRTARSIGRLVRLWIESGVAAVWLPELIAPAGQDATLPPSGGPAQPGAHPWVGRLTDRARVLESLEHETGLSIPRDPVLLTTLLSLDPVATLVRLKAPNAEISRAAAVVSGRREPDGTSTIQVRRWMAGVGDAADDLTLLWRLRNGTTPPWEFEMRGIRERGEPLTRRHLAITGTDLQEIGVAAGPAMGIILDRLVALVVDDPALNSREQLLERARSMR